MSMKEQITQIRRALQNAAELIPYAKDDPLDPSNRLGSTIEASPQSWIRSVNEVADEVQAALAALDKLEAQPPAKAQEDESEKRFLSDYDPTTGGTKQPPAKVDARTLAAIAYEWFDGPVDNGPGSDVDKLAAHFATRIGSPEQEPVAWMSDIGTAISAAEYKIWRDGNDERSANGQVYGP